MARYSQKTEERILARLLPPESAPLEKLARNVGISILALERWRAEALAPPAGGRGQRPRAAMQLWLLLRWMRTQKNCWCREHGLYASELDGWRQGAINALADPEDARATRQATRADQRRIQELERDLLRKDPALAETTALLILAICA